MAQRLSRILSTAGAAGLFLAGAQAAYGQSSAYEEYRARDTVTYGGMFRNFTASTVSGGHPDFTRVAENGVGRYIGIPGNTLDDDGKPVYGSSGHKLRINWRDSALRNVIPSKSYIDSWPGDLPGLANEGAGEDVHSPSSFAQWFRTQGGVNTASGGAMTLTLNRSTAVYSFDGSLDAFHGSPDYSYTAEYEVPFIYEPGNNWYLSARTNGDVFLFVDDKLVLDNGGGMGARPACAVENSIIVENSFVVNFSEESSSAISTNSIAPGAVSIQNSGVVLGDVMVGPGGDPATGITVSQPDSILGTTGSLGASVPIQGIVSSPTGMPASSGNVTIHGGTATWTGDLHYGTLTVRNGAIVTVMGICRIMCDGLVEFRQGTEVRLDPNARLELYTSNSINVENSVNINVNTQNPDQVMFVVLGTGTITCDNNTNVFAHLLAPLGAVHIGNSTAVYGTVTADSCRFYNNGQLTGMGTFAAQFGGSSVAMNQRINLDRLSWLDPERTHTLKVFFANRTGNASTLKLDTNMLLLNVAALPNWRIRLD